MTKKRQQKAVNNGNPKRRSVKEERSIKCEVSKPLRRGTLEFTEESREQISEGPAEERPEEDQTPFIKERLEEPVEIPQENITTHQQNDYQDLQPMVYPEQNDQQMKFPRDQGLQSLPYPREQNYQQLAFPMEQNHQQLKYPREQGLRSLPYPRDQNQQSLPYQRGQSFQYEQLDPCQNRHMQQSAGFVETYGQAKYQRDHGNDFETNDQSMRGTPSQYRTSVFKEYDDQEQRANYLPHSAPRVQQETTPMRSRHIQFPTPDFSPIPQVDESPAVFRARVIAEMRGDFDPLMLGRIIYGSQVDENTKEKILSDIITKSKQITFEMPLFPKIKNGPRYLNDDEARAVSWKFQYKLFQSVAKTLKPTRQISALDDANILAKPNKDFITSLKIPVESPFPFKAGGTIEVESLEFNGSNPSLKALHFIRSIMQQLTEAPLHIKWFTYRAEGALLYDFSKIDYDAPLPPNPDYAPLPDMITDFIKDALIDYFGYNRDLFNMQLTENDRMALRTYQELGSSPAERQEKFIGMVEEKDQVISYLFSRRMGDAFTDLRKHTIIGEKWVRLSRVALTKQSNKAPLPIKSLNSDSVCTEHDKTQNCAASSGGSVTPRNDKI